MFKNMSKANYTGKRKHLELLNFGLVHCLTSVLQGDRANMKHRKRQEGIYRSTSSFVKTENSHSGLQPYFRTMGTRAKFIPKLTTGIQTQKDTNVALSSNLMAQEPMNSLILIVEFKN